MSLSTDVTYLLDLPDNVLLEEIFPQLPFESLLKLCTVNRRFHRLCLIDRLWQLRTYNYYPDKVNQKPTDITWRQYYTYLFNPIIREIPIDVFGQKSIGKINLHYNSTLKSLSNRILNLAHKNRYSLDNYLILFYEIPARDKFNTRLIGYSKPNIFKLKGPIKNIDYASLVLDPNKIAALIAFGGME